MLSLATTVFLPFGLGWVMSRRGVLQPRHADMLLRLMVNVGLPALIVAALAGLPLTPENLLLPLIGALTVILSLAASWLILRRVDMPRAKRGVLLIAPAIMNIAFAYPFVVGRFGLDGVGYFALFDLGHGAMVMTLVYGVACRMGGDLPRWWDICRRVAGFPPLWALLVGLTLNLLGTQLPEALVTGLSVIGRASLLGLMIALGVYFHPALWREPLLWAALGLRVVLGGGLGVALVWLSGLEGMPARLALIGVVAPVGFNTLVFASREGLDKTFAAGVLSISLLLGLVYLPLLIGFMPG